MKERKSETIGDNYDKRLYSELESFLGKYCRLVLKGNDVVAGRLNHVGIGPDGPYVIFDMGDAKISGAHNLNFSNILGVINIDR